MRAFVIFFFAILAMAAAQKAHTGKHPPHYNPNHVNVVDYNPEYDTNQVHVVDFNPDNDQSQVHVVENNPESDATQVNVVENSASSSDTAEQVIIANPDPFFSQPSNGPSGGSEPISIGPAFVQNYPPKQYDNPYARGGK